MKEVIHLFVPGPFGGAEQVILTGLQELKESVSLELWIIKEQRVPEFADYFIEEAKSRLIPFKVLEVRSIVDFNLIKSLKQKLPSDALYHAHGLKASLYAYLSKKNSPLIITHHGDTSHTFKVRIYEAIQRFVMKRANLVIAVSNQMKMDLSKFSIPSVVIENLLSISNEIESTRSSKQPLKLVIIGRLSQEKGVNTLIEAIKSIDNIKLDIIGSGIEEQKLINLVEDTQQSKKIVFKGFQTNIAEIINQADCLVMPSHREGLPMTLIETICLGKPVIGSKVGAISELVTTNGITVPPKNVPELTKAIEELILNYEKYETEAKRLMPIFTKRFSVKTWCQNTIKVYKSL